MKFVFGSVAQWAAVVVGTIMVSYVEGAANSLAIARHNVRRVAFGPAGCVSLSRSKAGTCVLATNCDGQDLSKVEFAFDCEAARDGSIIRHSFGVGGFDSYEEFDTEVECKRCSAPSPTDKIVGPAKSAPRLTYREPVQMRVPDMEEKSSSTALHVTTRTMEQKTQIRYGPKDCVSTYKSPDDHCIINTNCAASDIQDYEFGFVCVDKAGSPVRHLFGKNSFDPSETFDTLIMCDRCLGLDDVPADVSLVGEVADLSKEITALKGMMSNLTTDVTKLKTAVFTEDSQADTDASTIGFSATDTDDGDTVETVQPVRRKTGHLRAAKHLSATASRHALNARRHRLRRGHLRKAEAADTEDEEDSASSVEEDSSGDEDDQQQQESEQEDERSVSDDTDDVENGEDTGEEEQQ